jgi:hypothetical protein
VIFGNFSINDKKPHWKFLLVCDGIAFLIIIGLSIYILQPLISFGTATTTDSIYYLDVSQNIADGFGLVESTYLLGPEKFKPFTSWPPVYPFVLSFFASPHLTGPIEAARLAFVSLTITVMLMYFILRQFLGIFLALLGALILLFSHPILTVFSYAWSETLFIPLLLFACLIGNFCIKSSDTIKIPRHISCVLGLTISLVALVYCRYIGIVFIIFLPLTWLLGKNKKTLLKYYISAIVLYIGLVSILLSRNLSLTGNLGGISRQNSTKSILNNFSDLWGAIQIQFSYSPDLFWPILLVVLVAILIKYFANRESIIKHSANNKTTPKIIWICLVGVTSYLVSLLLLRSLYEFDRIDTRLISLIWPFIIIILFFGINLKWNFEYNIIIKSLIFICSIVFLTLIFNRGLAVYNQVLFIQQIYKKTYGFYGYPSEKYKYNNMTLKIVENDSKKFVRMIYDLKKFKYADTLITDFSDPRIIQLLSGIKSRKFPSGEINSETVKLINNADENGMVLIINDSTKDYIYSYYKNNQNIPPGNKHFLNEYQALLIPLPLPRAD